MPGTVGFIVYVSSHATCISGLHHILGPLLFLMMVADMHKFVIGDSPNANLMTYADDSTLYVHSKSMDLLLEDLERLSA